MYVDALCRAYELWGLDTTYIRKRLSPLPPKLCRQGGLASREASSVCFSTQEVWPSAQRRRWRYEHEASCSSAPTRQGFDAMGGALVCPCVGPFASR